MAQAALVVEQAELPEPQATQAATAFLNPPAAKAVRVAIALLNPQGPRAKIASIPPVRELGREAPVPASERAAPQGRDRLPYPIKRGCRMWRALGPSGPGPLPLNPPLPLRPRLPFIPTFLLCHLQGRPIGGARGPLIVIDQNQRIFSGPLRLQRAFLRRGDGWLATRLQRGRHQ